MLRSKMHQPGLILICLIVAPVIGLLVSGKLSAQQSTTNATKIDRSFELRDVDGKIVSLASSPDRQLTVVCFLGTECPLAKLYAGTLNRMVADFHEKPVRMIGVNSNRQDSEEELSAYSGSLNLQFPISKDHRNIVADQFGAQRTPEVFVLDQDLNIVYQGRIDDQYLPGISKAKPTREDLRIAIDQWLDGETVSVQKTEAKGCIIGRVNNKVSGADLDDSTDDSAVTFSNQVSRVLQKHCVECHREGDIGPFSLTDYEEVVGWGEMLTEVVDEGRMPPWHANPDHGDFSNTRHMPDDDKQILRDWVEAGSPFGTPEQLPPLPERVEGWKLAKDPDIVVQMRGKPFKVPAEGIVDYQYFVVDPKFQEDKWVVSAEVRPGNRSVVHHSIVFVRPPDGASFEGLGWLSAYVPGQRATNYPPGYARRIPAGSKLVFQQHYTPVGTEQNDITEIGLVFGEQPDVTHKVFTVAAIDQQFEIPPQSEHNVETTVRGLPSHGLLLGVAPHMHFRGKSCRVTTVANETEQVMLDVPNYDFNWQHSYSLKTPLDLETVDQINFRVTFDNTDNNPVNPDSSQSVFWGDQTWEEMAVAFFEVAMPLELGDGTDPRNRIMNITEFELSKREKVALDKFVDDFFTRFDKDKDGRIVRDELPHAMRKFLTNWNRGGDKVLLREDVRRNAEWDFRQLEEREATSGSNK